MRDKENISNNWQQTTLGRLPSDWTIVNAEEFCLKVSDGTHATPTPKKAGKFLVTSRHIKNGKVDVSSAYKISKADFDEINKRSKVDKWDVLFSMIGTVGEISLVDHEPDFAIKNIGLFKCGDEFKARWLFYYLRGKIGQGEIIKRMTGTTQSYIKLGDLRTFPVILPRDHKELKDITSILSILDDKIELLKKQNRTLEHIAQVLFKSWFIDFDFPNNDGKPYKSSGGKMIDCELGEIPEGWHKGKLGNATDIRGGTTPRTDVSEYWNGNINWTSPKDLSNARDIFLLDTEKKITEKGLSQIGSGMLPKGTLLLSSRAPIGYLAITDIPIAINQGYIALLPGAVFSNLYMYLWLKRDIREVISAANGSTFLEISKGSFKTIPCIIPEQKVLDSFEEVVTPIFNKILLNIKQIKVLTLIRDTILPKLMKGEIRIKDFID